MIYFKISRPYVLYVPDQFKTQEMCDKAVVKDPDLLECVLDQFKTQKMCDKAVEKNPRFFEYVPDYFNSDKLCCKVIDKNVNKKVLNSINEYRKRNAQKHQIRYELLPVAWHPSRFYDWCCDNDEKRFLKEMWRVADCA